MAAALADAVPRSRARAADVLREWSGLGYNRRALNLQRAARRVVELGEFPRDIAGLEQLPGIGPYTARAIACFAFGAQVTALDTNVRARARARLGTTDVEPPHGPRVGVEPGALRPRRPGVPCAHPALRRLPARRALSLPEASRFAPLRRQSRFEGSRRQRRAALVRELADGPRDDRGYDRDVVESLLADGLAVRRADGLLALPEEVSPA